MTKIRCGVIGLGRLGSQHAANIAGCILGSELLAVSDSSPEVLNRFQSQYPLVQTFQDYHELLALKELDAVVIASSTSMHYEMIVASLQAGKAIFCEKPLTLDRKEALALKTLVHEKKAFVQLGFMRRFDKGYQQAKKMIESGAIGKPISLLGISRDPSCPPLAFAKTSGGLIADLCVHDIDLCRWFSGSEVTQVYARGGVVRYDELLKIGDIDHVNIDFTFENGFLCSLEGSRNSSYGYDVRTEVVCTQGAAFIGKLNDSSLRVMDSQGIHKETIPGFLERFKAAYLAEMEHFISDLREGNPSSVPVEEGLMALELVLAANESLRTNSPVSIKNTKDI
ncbi:Gfo/Idh/MocA family oxidoreductase [uncultured Sphaerochaeta sp.]|uniref:Gfo/Idh/MocA family protein n=1 Tax=uncultured Sphaerochaeta sp. TaxID=886478 RepID=UPI002A0A4BA3|nr:Gfo/Idh/MocA family oxidoreductase [uncultured Sphaerochaeta sp.]